LLQTQRSQVEFPAIPDFLSSSGSGTRPFSFGKINEELLERNINGYILES
jgi:hypothetical protein